MKIAHITINNTHPYFKCVKEFKKEDEYIIYLNYDNKIFFDEKEKEIFLDIKKCDNPKKINILVEKLFIIHKFDLINIHILPKIPLLPILNAAASLGIRKILTLHDYSLFCEKGIFQKNKIDCDINSLVNCDCENFNKKNYKKEYLDILMGQTDKIICFSNYQKNKLDALTNQKYSNKIKRVYHGIYPEFKKIKNEKKDKKITIGYIGSLSPIKGINTLINLIDKFENNKLIDFKFCISSNYLIPKELVKKGEDIKKKFEVFEDLKYENLHLFFEKIDYLIIPSLWQETGPLTLYESLYFNKPVIIPNIESMVEKVNKNCSHIYNDLEELYNIIKYISTKKIDYVFPKVKNFTEYNKELYEIYNSILVEKKGLMLKTGYLCNNKCLFCSVEDNKPQKFVAFESIKDLLIKSKKDFDQLIFSNSGDATFHPDFFEIINLAKLLGYELILFTNCNLISKNQFFDKLKKYYITYIIAISGHNNKIQDELTNSKDSLLKIDKAIENLNSVNSKIIGRILINKLNYKNLKDIANFFISKNVKEIMVVFMTPVGGAKKRFDMLIPKYLDVMPYFKELTDYLENYNINIIIEGFPFCLIHKEYEKTLEYSQLNINHNFVGVYPDDEKENYYLNEGRFRDKIKFEKCKKCKFDAICEGVYNEYIKNYEDEEFIPILN